MWIASLACLGVPLLALASPDLELSFRQAEEQMLNLRISWKGVISTKDGHLKTPPPHRLTVLHLWAINCPSCVAELTWFKKMVASYRNEQDVGFVLISETANEKDLEAFLNRQKDDIPQVEYYKNADSIRTILQNDKQPLTLLLDRDLVVRQAFVGSIVDEHRAAEFVSAITRLQRAGEKKEGGRGARP